MSDLSTHPPRPHSASAQLLLRPKNLVSGLQPEYSIDHFPATIGRHPTNDIELPFEAISRYHARIESNGGLMRLVDLRSSNGTFVNGDRVQSAMLSDQDSVSFGGIEFAVVMQEPSAIGTAPIEPEAAITSVHFILDHDTSQTIYHTELPDDTSGISSFHEEITNADELKKARQQLVTLYRLQDVLRSTMEEKRLLRRVLHLLFDVLPVERGVILMRDEEDASIFRPIAIKTKADLPKMRIGISKTILQRCMREKVALMTQDIPESNAASDATGQAARVRSVLCVPLISMRQVFGFCHLDTTDAVRSFTEEDLTFMANVGSELATHLHNLRMLNDKIMSERMAAIGQTITGMAHNIKNILVLTQGGIEMMEKRLTRKNYDTLEETWTVVRRGLGRINQMVQDMLDYSRARTVEKRRVDINALLAEIHHTYSAEFQKRRINCHLSLDDNCIPLMLDADGLEKALANLLVNAVEAVEEGKGEIWLATKVNEEGNLQVEVADNGEGIPKEVLPRIFVPFFTTKGSKGSGLGLAMTRKFVEDMGGRIEVQTVEKKGTCFRITLFVVSPAPQLREAVDNPEADEDQP